MRAPAPRFRGKRIRKNLNNSIYKNLENISRSNHLTFFVTLISIFSIVINRFSGNKQIALATPVANRLNEKTEALMGHLINTVIFLTRINPELSFKEFLLNNKETITQLLTNQHYPFEQLVDNLKLTRNINKNPISQIMFSFQNHQVENINFAGAMIENIDIDTHYSRFDIEWQVWCDNKSLSLDIFFNTDIYKKTTIEKLLQQFCELLEELPSILEKKLIDIYYRENNKLSISEGEDRRWPKLLAHQYIEHHAAMNPNIVALYFKERTLSFLEINSSINKTASFLASLGLSKRDRIILLAERSETSLIILLACFKLGILFIPLSTDNPPDRINYIISDVAPNLLIIDNNSSFTDHIINLNIITISELENKTSHHSGTNFQTSIKEYDPAYMIYTSGSTGKPKGVMISHKSLINTILSIIDTIKLTEKDHWLAITPLSFDIAFLELLTPLVIGGKLTIAHREMTANIKLLKDKLSKEEITVAQTTPSFWKLILDAGWIKGKNTKIISGGESLSHVLANRLLNTGAQLWNAYGPTETTIWSLIKSVYPNNNDIPIGVPLANTQCYVLDDDKIILPVNQLGELYLAGDGIALCYWNLPSLLKDKFTDITLPNGITKRCYRTGDRVTMLESGDFLFHGRKDDQVKIKGFRVEVAEIEHALIQHPYIDQAAVIIKNQESSPTVSAFVSLAQNHTLNSIISNDWKSVFDNIYHQSSQTTFCGWLSSYTHQPFSNQEMEDWLLNFENLVNKQSPSSILEIGCGLGLLIQKLALLCEKYVATDISDTAINSLRNKVNLNNVILECTEAHKAFQHIDTATDTVLINSVIQYFPSLNYLENLIETLANSLSPNSTIIIGDVRNYELAKLANASFLHFSNKLPKDAMEAMDIIETNIANDHELLVSPNYFLILKEKIPSISHLEIQPKLSKYSNELNKYRFDVVLHINSKKPSLNPDIIIDYQSITNLDNINDILNAHKNNVILIKNFTNALLAEDFKAFRWLIPSYSKELISNCLYPEQIINIGEDHNLSAKFRISNPATGTYDAIFYPTRDASEPLIFQYETEVTFTNLYHEPNNDYSITRQITEYLASKIPHYMLPSELKILQHFPLVSNGKIDKKALEKLSIKKQTKFAFISSSTQEEIPLSKIWSEVLSLDEIKPSDNFFELGGYSLLALQLLARANHDFNVNLPLYDFYKNPTLSGHWEAIQHFDKVAKETILINSSPEANTLKQTISDSKNIIFLLPPIDGGSAWYTKLAEYLHEKFNCYAFEQPSELAQNGTTIEKSAEYYLQKIRLMQPSGPYHVIGWSFGGLIAFEICRLLHRMGEDVKSPILIDTPAPQDAAAIQAAYKNVELLPPSRNNKNMKNPAECIYYNSLAYIHYSPEPIRLGKVTIIQADNTIVNTPTQKNYWNQISQAEFFILKNSDHYSILKQPNAKKVAKHIIQTMELPI